MTTDHDQPGTAPRTGPPTPGPGSSDPDSPAGAGQHPTDAPGHITVLTRTHGRCAVQDCPATRQDAIATGTPWHVINAFVTHTARRAEVIESWAEACEQHHDPVRAAVETDAHTGTTPRTTITRYDFSAQP